ncbi:adenylosuccinate synthetase, partial [Enterococcus faecium]|nr:adenylosuccinate synthetase [Enterococcus faecium]
IKLDQLQEDAKGENKIGTTIKGIGPAFSQPLIHGVPKVASSKNKSKFHKNLRSSFRTFLLIS